MSTRTRHPKQLVAALAALMTLPTAALAQDTAQPPPPAASTGQAEQGQPPPEPGSAGQAPQGQAPQQGEEGTGQGGSGQAGQTQAKKAPPSPAKTFDVEELNDNIASHAGQRVAVVGEISEFLDLRSFVLESGGIFDDEITVVLPSQGVKGLPAASLREDADVRVTGTVRAMPVVEMRRELGWDLDPQLEVELEGVRHFLVAERITRQRD